MLCNHIFHRARKTLMIDWHRVQWSHRPGRVFYRADGTSGESDYVVMCERCAAKDPKEALADFIAEAHR